MESIPCVAVGSRACSLGKYDPVLFKAISCTAAEFELFAEQVNGVVLSDGTQLKYKMNGFASLLIVAVMVVLAYTIDGHHPHTYS